MRHIWPLSDGGRRIPLANWGDRCERMRDRAKAIVKSKPELLERQKDALGRALAEDEIRYARTRIQSLDGREAIAEAEQLALERSLNEALHRGISSPSVRVDVAGAVFLTSEPVSFGGVLKEKWMSFGLNELQALLKDWHRSRISPIRPGRASWTGFARFSGLRGTTWPKRMASRLAAVAAACPAARGQEAGTATRLRVPTGHGWRIGKAGRAWVEVLEAGPSAYLLNA
jgi:hypothetical protein